MNTKHHSNNILLNLGIESLNEMQEVAQTTILQDSNVLLLSPTGSGKTLTSFKTAQLVSKLSFVDKVVFVVDRKDLDYQTMKEYDKFEKGAANSNTSTSVLKKQLEDPNSRIIITTIQKFPFIVSGVEDLSDRHFAVIIDEAHSSQGGQAADKIRIPIPAVRVSARSCAPVFRGSRSCRRGWRPIAERRRLRSSVLPASHDRVPSAGTCRPRR